MKFDFTSLKMELKREKNSRTKPLICRCLQIITENNDLEYAKKV
jgi:hypothetical protein